MSTLTITNSNGTFDLTVGSIVRIRDTSSAHVHYDMFKVVAIEGDVVKGKSTLLPAFSARKIPTQYINWVE